MNGMQAPTLDSEPLPLGEVLDFMRVMWAVDHALQTTSKRMKRTAGITGPQRLVLRIVGRFPGIPAGQLARLLHVHPSTLSGVLKRLESSGLLARRPDPRDARRALLGLTPEGRKLDVQAEGTVEAAVQLALGGVPRAKVQATREVLTALTLALEPRSS